MVNVVESVLPAVFQAVLPTARYSTTQRFSEPKRCQVKAMLWVSADAVAWGAVQGRGSQSRLTASEVSLPQRTRNSA